MHRKRGVDSSTSPSALAQGVKLRDLGASSVLLLQFLLALSLRLSIVEAFAGGPSNLPSLESAAVEAVAVVVVPLANDLATANDDAAVSKSECGLCSLLHAERQVVVSARRHCVLVR